MSMRLAAFDKKYDIKLHRTPRMIQRCALFLNGQLEPDDAAWFEEALLTPEWITASVLYHFMARQAERTAAVEEFVGRMQGSPEPRGNA